MVWLGNKAELSAGPSLYVLCKAIGDSLTSYTGLTKAAIM